MKCHALGQFYPFTVIARFWIWSPQGFALNSETRVWWEGLQPEALPAPRPLSLTPREVTCSQKVTKGSDLLSNCSFCNAKRHHYMRIQRQWVARLLGLYSFGQLVGLFCIVKCSHIFEKEILYVVNSTSERTVEHSHSRMSSFYNMQGALKHMTLSEIWNAQSRISPPQPLLQSYHSCTNSCMCVRNSVSLHGCFAFLYDYIREFVLSLLQTCNIDFFFSHSIPIHRRPYSVQVGEAGVFFGQWNMGCWELWLKGNWPAW